MRVVTGEARGKNIKTLEGRDVRPTAAKVKEGEFSAVQFYLAGARVLDLFAGSGQLGIEALSRGAKSALFVDMSRDSCSLIKQNLHETGFLECSKVVNEDCGRFVRRCDQRFDIIFVDPPYRQGLASGLLPGLGPLLAEGGIAMIETEREGELPERAGELELKKRYNYGKTSVWQYRRAGEAK